MQLMSAGEMMKMPRVFRIFLDFDGVLITKFSSLSEKHVGFKNESNLRGMITWDNTEICLADALIYSG